MASQAFAGHSGEEPKEVKMTCLRQKETGEVAKLRKLKMTHCTLSISTSRYSAHLVGILTDEIDVLTDIHPLIREINGTIGCSSRTNVSHS